LEKYLIVYGKPRFLGYLFSNREEPFERGTWIHAQTERGEELVLVIGKAKEESPSEEKEQKSVSREHRGQHQNQENTIQKVDFIEKAREELLKEREDLEKDEAEILCTARKILRKHDLAMKLVDAEFLLGKKKLFLYFTSEDRVDFRSYVRDLAREFKTRIELRQIGIRDEARVVGGLASCGRQCCCSYWLHQFSPICIRMVKEQNLALNPTKISGICGRLMCCMSYEHFMYKDLWDHLPNPGTKIRGPEATYVLSGVDIVTESARIFGMGREILVPIAKYKEFCSVIQEGKEWESDIDQSPSKKPFVPPSSKPLVKGRKDDQNVRKDVLQTSEKDEKDVRSSLDNATQKENPKKKLQRRKKSSQSKVLGNNSSTKKEEGAEGKKETSQRSRKTRGGKRKQEPSGSQNRAPRKSRSSKISPEKQDDSSKISREEKKEPRKKNPSSRKDQNKDAPLSKNSSQKKAEGDNAASQPQRKRRRRPRKRAPQPGNDGSGKDQNKSSQEKTSSRE